MKELYGYPQNQYGKEQVNDLYENLECALGLSRYAVGVKLFFDAASYESFKWEEPKGKQAYCCIVEKATRGRCFKAQLKHINCDGGTTALHLEPSTNRIESGEEYFSYNLYHSAAGARRVREGVPGLYRTGAKTYGIAVGPLKDFEIAPDVLIFMVNPYQSMRLQQGYVYKEGGRIQVSGASMQALCAEATIEPYLTGRLNMTPLCPSTRFLAKWKDEEMAIGIPFEKFEGVVEGVLATMSTTDTAKRKEEIIKRFEAVGKQITIDPSL